MYVSDSESEKKASFLALLSKHSEHSSIMASVDTLEKELTKWNYVFVQYIKYKRGLHLCLWTFGKVEKSSERPWNIFQYRYVESKNIK